MSNRSPSPQRHEACPKQSTPIPMESVRNDVSVGAPPVGSPSQAHSTTVAWNQTRGLRDLQVQWVSVEKLIPYAGNSRTHTAAQVAQVAASIRQFGWTNPLLIRPDGVIIAGHARLLAARQLGMREVPVIELGGLSEAQCRALVIADNQLALNAGWDEEMLRAELAALREENFPLDL